MIAKKFAKAANERGFNKAMAQFDLSIMWMNSNINIEQLKIDTGQDDIVDGYVIMFNDGSYFVAGNVADHTGCHVGIGDIVNNGQALMDLCPHIHIVEIPEQVH